MASSSDRLTIPTLGPAEVLSPLEERLHDRGDFTADSARICGRLNSCAGCGDEENGPLLSDGTAMFEKAGPRQQLFFKPAEVTAAIVTCGGLCPGLNNVIRSAFMELYHNYGVSQVLGIRFGYSGMNPEDPDFQAPLLLTTRFVKDIHELGGTALGSARGPQDPAKMVDYLYSLKVNLLLCVGGDGTQRGAHAIAQDALRRGIKLAVIGIPKTIDNDVHYVSQSFGYSTALETAVNVIRAAHVESRGAQNGIGLVKLMGRDAGFIAAGAALASQEVNFVLIPEVPFPLEGESGLLEVLKKRLLQSHHAVIVVAEGAGQHLFASDIERRKDASGNVRAIDIGPHLQERILSYFKEQKIRVTLKYIDPSYIIRSVPANAHDRSLCDRMARSAVHAGMAGKTDMLVGMIHGAFVHVPITEAIDQKKRLQCSGELWSSVVMGTGQPNWPGLKAAARTKSGGGD